MAIDRTSVLELLACCAISESLFREFELKPEAAKDKLVQLWHAAVSKHYRDWADMPSSQYLVAVLQTALEALEIDEQSVLLGELQRTLALLNQFRGRPAADVERVGRGLLRRYMSTLLAEATTKELAEKGDNAREIFEEAARRAASIDGLESGRFQPMFPEDGLGTEKMSFVSTGVDFVQKFLGGGAIAGEVIGYLAPSGGGKTTLVLQVAWHRVEQLLVKYRGMRPQDIPWAEVPRVYVMAYEIVVNLMMNHISNSASIPRATAKTMVLNKDLGLLSSSAKKDYKDYEKAMFGESLDRASRGEGLWPPGELERFQRAAYITNRCLDVVKFAGDNPALLEWASMGVQGVRNYVQSDQDRLGKPGVDFVFVDYAGSMVDAKIASGASRIDNRTQLIKMVPGELSREIASRFHCPVWSAHQLNSTQNKQRGGTIPDPREADGSGMYHEQCAIAMASGMPNKEGVAVCILAKQRREEMVNMQVAKLDGTFARWVNAEKDYDIVQGQVVSRKEVNADPRGRVATAGRFIPPSAAFGNL